MDTLQLYESPLILDAKGEGSKNSSNALNIDEKLLFELDPAHELSFDLTRYLNNSSPATHVLSPDTSVATKPVKAELTSPVHSDYATLGPSVTSPRCYSTPQPVCMPEFEQLVSGSEDSEAMLEHESTVKGEDIGYTACNYPGSSSYQQVTSPSSVTSSTPVSSPCPSSRDSRKRSVPKGSEEYIEKRARNNVAVRKSRAKAKEKQKQTEGRVGSLQSENERLQKKVDLLTKELNVLKGLFINVGSALPSNFAKLLES